jgi:hypothetical protein
MKLINKSIIAFLLFSYGLSSRRRNVYAQVYIPSIFRVPVTCSLLIDVFLITFRVIRRVRAEEKACTVLETEKHINDLEYVGAGGNIILKQMVEKELDWIYLAKD